MYIYREREILIPFLFFQRLAAENDEVHRRAWRALSKQQRELKEKVEALSRLVRQSEPSADDLDEVADTSQIMRCRDLLFIDVFIQRYIYTYT